ncbi:MAG: 4Fe-4S binding protein [Candidatus Diapherotrites archaeon]|nr:4Fe-4S binding protein [Candidatus Diapherotrites archaeon]
MGVKIDRTKCCYCGACVSICPVNCMELKETRLTVDNNTCINCQACVRMCPVGAIALQKELKAKEE